MDPLSPRASESAGVLLGLDVKAAIAEAAVNLGIICTSCKQAMEGPGFEFVSIRPEAREGRPTIVIGRQFICARDECAAAREDAHSRATAVRPAGGWTAFYGEEGKEGGESGE